MKGLIGVFLFLIMLSVGVLAQDRLPEETMNNIAGGYLLISISVVSLGVFLGGRIKGGK